MTNTITNLVATLIINVVTNVNTADNAVPASGSSYYYLNNPQGTTIVQGVPATERTTTTVIKEVHELQFDWEGVKWSTTQEYELLRTVKKEVKHEEWVEQAVSTNVERRKIAPMWLNWNAIAVISPSNVFLAAESSSTGSWHSIEPVTNPLALLPDLGVSKTNNNNSWPARKKK